MMSFLGRNELLDAFGSLDDELGRMGVDADLFVVGGAAMAVAYDARRATTDVDAVFAPGPSSKVSATVRPRPEGTALRAVAFVGGHEDHW